MASKVNKHKGCVPLKIGSVDGVLVYDWTALSTLKASYTDEQLQNLPKLPVDAIIGILLAGFQKHSPEITQAEIIEASPPLMEVYTAIDSALLYAYHGPETAEQILESIKEIQKNIEAAGAAAQTAGKKKKK